MVAGRVAAIADLRSFKGGMVLLMMSASLGTPVVVRGYERAGLVVQLESRIDLEIAATSAQVQFAGLTSARGEIR